MVTKSLSHLFVLHLCCTCRSPVLLPIHLPQVSFVYHICFTRLITSQLLFTCLPYLSSFHLAHLLYLFFHLFTCFLYPSYLLVPTSLSHSPVSPVLHVLPVPC